MSKGNIIGPLHDDKYAYSDKQNLNDNQGRIQNAPCQTPHQACINDDYNNCGHTRPNDDKVTIFDVKNPLNDDVVIKILCGRRSTIFWVWDAVLKNGEC